MAGLVTQILVTLLRQPSNTTGDGERCPICGRRRIAAGFCAARSKATAAQSDGETRRQRVRGERGLKGRQAPEDKESEKSIWPQNCVTARHSLLPRTLPGGTSGATLFPPVTTAPTRERRRRRKDRSRPPMPLLRKSPQWPAASDERRPTSPDTLSKRPRNGTPISATPEQQLCIRARMAT